MKRIATNPIRNFAARLVPAVGYGTRNAGRLLLALGFTAALTSLASCTDTDDDDLSAFRPGAATSLSVSALPGYSADNATPDANTRAFDPTAPIGVIDHGKTAWEEGDSLAMRITFNESENTSSPFGTAYAYATYNSGAWTLGDGLTTVTNSSKENLCFAVRGGKVLWPARAKSITVDAIYAPGQTFDANGELCATRPENLGRGETWIASTTLNTPNAAIALSGWKAECIRLRVAAAPGDVVKITAPGFIPTGSLMGTALDADESLTATADKQGNACFYGYTDPITGAVTLTVSLANSYAYGSTVIPVFKNTREFAPSDVVGAGRSYAINALADTELDGVTDWDGFVPGKSTYYGTLARLDASKDMWIITDAEPDYSVLNAKLREVASADPARRINLSLPKATSVGDNAFEECTALAGVSLPVATSVGQYAFKFCTALITLSLPEATSVGDGAFFECTALTTLSLPKASSVGDNAFYGCTNLTTISLPEATSVGKYAFNRCTSLTTLTTLSLPKATSVGDYAFERCESLTTLSLPKVTSVGNYAFYRCTSLTGISLPEVTSVGEHAFKKCESLTTISLPEATSVGDYAFNGCTGLTTISLPKAFISIKNEMFRDFKALKTVFLPRATSVGDYAFYGCTNLTDISLPEVTSVGYLAFYGCTNLTDISLLQATSVGEHAFYGCTNLTTISLPMAMSVGSSTFYGCTSLTDISLPEATSVEYSAFDGCTSLTTLTFGKPITNWGTSVLDNNIASNVTLTLAAGQMAMEWNGTTFQAGTNAFTDFGTGKVFCGADASIPYTFKEIKKHW